MTIDRDVQREQVRALLTQAQIEIESTLESVDSAGAFELAEIRGAAASLRAFFDFNGSCATESFDPVAFFDFNGSCSASDLRKFSPQAFFDFNGSCAAADAPVGRAVRTIKK